jgi:hypothetical protein
VSLPCRPLGETGDHLLQAALVRRIEFAEMEDLQTASGPQRKQGRVTVREEGRVLPDNGASLRALGATITAVLFPLPSLSLFPAFQAPT